MTLIVTSGLFFLSTMCVCERAREQKSKQQKTVTPLNLFPRSCIPHIICYRPFENLKSLHLQNVNVPVLKKISYAFQMMFFEFRKKD